MEDIVFIGFLEFIVRKLIYFFIVIVTITITVIIVIIILWV